MSSSDSNEYTTPTHLNPWVIASVATICGIILIFSYFRIATQLFGPPPSISFSRNRVPSRRLLDESNTDDPSLQFHSHGLDFSTIHSLPVTQFKEKSEGEASKTRSTDCAVCLGEFKEGEWLRHLPGCSHSFHISCIDSWFLNHSNCPLCRSEVQTIEMEDLECPVQTIEMEDLECPVPVDSHLRTLQREDFFRERAAHYQLLRSEILQNSVSRHNPREEI
ncbi:hypothetical protein TIFTF001_000533 [Ficus carica]|uniref:RING-type E3 ubiquitin transferase n=1 Tax=Ficus carica TaxID=3494 RepID=A0AA87Z375_FICCA|nr:hypothetical protein TIFTF001_000533 [Ficus carica]